MRNLKAFLFTLLTLIQFSASAGSFERYTLCEGKFNSQAFAIKIISNLDSENLVMKLHLNSVDQTSDLTYRASFQGSMTEYIYIGRKQINGDSTIQVKIAADQCTSSSPAICPAVFTASHIWGETLFEQPVQCKSIAQAQNN